MEEGGVGIVFHASRAGRVLVVKSLVSGGAAEKSGAVQIGYQIIEVDDKKVTSASLEEVAGLLRGPLDSNVQLRFLETRDIHLVIERTVPTTGDKGTVGIKWQQGSADLVVDKIHPDFSGFGGSPKPGDRLIRIQGESIDNMPDDEVKRRLTGDIDSSIRLDFAREVGHHSVTLTRQALVLVQSSRIPHIPPTVPASESPSTANGEETVVASRHKDNRLSDSPAAAAFMSANSASSDRSTDRRVPPNAPQEEQVFNGKLSAPVQVFEAKTGQPLTQDLSPPPSQRSAAPQGKEEDSVNQQLVDIAKRLKLELEGQSSEILDMKASHRAEVERLQRSHLEEMKRFEAKIEMASLQGHHQSVPSDELAKVRTQLETAQEDLRKKETELTSVKTVMLRRAESAGDTVKKLDDLTNEKQTLTARCAQLAKSLEDAEQAIHQLRSTREIDEKNLRDAADVALKWQIQEVERQAASARSELQTKCLEVNSAQETIKMQAQTLMKEQKQHETTESKLQEALTELNRLRASNQEYDAVATKTKKLYEETAQDLAAQKKKVTELGAEVDITKTRLEETEATYLKKLEETETEWEMKYVDAESEWNLKAQTAETEKERLEQNLTQAKAVCDSLNAKNAEMEALEVDQESKLKDTEATVKKQEEHIAELETGNQQSLERIEKLTEATQTWKEQLAAAQKTLESQAKALAEERRCSEELQEKADRMEKQTITLESELSGLKSIKAQHEMDQGRLQQYDELQQHIQSEAQKRNQMMQQIAGQVPYPQLLALLQDAKISVSNLQGVLQAKDQQMAAMQQQIHQTSKVREMTKDAEKQLFKLKESMDWKVIAMQQMSTVLKNCQGALHEPDLIEEIARALALAQQHMMSHEAISPARVQRKAEEPPVEVTADFDELPPMPVDTRNLAVPPGSGYTHASMGSTGATQSQYPVHVVHQPTQNVQSAGAMPGYGQQQAGGPGAYSIQNQYNVQASQQPQQPQQYNSANMQQAAQGPYHPPTLPPHPQQQQQNQAVARPLSHGGTVGVPGQQGPAGQQGPRGQQLHQSTGMPNHMSPNALHQHQAAQAAMGLTHSHGGANPAPNAASAAGDQARGAKQTTYEL